MTSTLSTDNLALTTSNHIVLDGLQTEYRAIQRKDATIVFAGNFGPNWTATPSLKILALPQAQYSLSCDKPVCGAGRHEFYADLKAAIANEKASA